MPYNTCKELAGYIVLIMRLTKLSRFQQCFNQYKNIIMKILDALENYLGVQIINK